MNKLTQKHLDFYYQQVLCLPFQPFTPDQVFVVFELAKGIQTFRLQEGTVLDAQKDQEGNKRQYKLDSKLVVNRAKVESCSALYAEKTNNQFYVQTKSSTDNDLRWRNFPKNQEGEVGIAVSDPILKLGEGTRFIVMTIDVKKKLKADLDLNPHTKVRLSSAESPDGWVKMASVGEGNTGNLEYLGVPHPTSGKGLTDNITGKRNIKNTNYSNFSTSTSLVRVINNNQIEVRVLVKKDSFSISIPESDIGDPIFRRLEYPMLKVTFSNQIGELLNDVNINKIRIVTESVGVKKGVQIRNQLGTFNNQDTVSLLGNPAASSSNETKAGAFVEFEVEEMKGKQLLGLAPEPNFLRPLNNNKGFPINKNEFEPRFRVIDDFRGYKVYKKGEEAKNEDNKEVPQLAGDYNNFKVSYDRTNELPTTSGKRGKQTPKESSSQGEFIFDPNVSALGSTMVKIPGVNNDLLYLEETTVLDRFVLPNTVSNPYGSSIYGVKIPFNSKVDSIAELKTFNKKRNKKNNNPESSTLKYSTLRNQNVLQLRYKEEVRAVKKGKPELKSDPAQVKGVSFRYSAQAILVNNNRIKQEFDCYHITPQGYNRINTTEFVGGKSLLPEYHLLSTDGNKTATTYLHIGIKELQPGQLLSLLFVTEEGTGNANFDPPAIQWQYLTKDEDGISDLWEDFPEGSIFSDATKFDQQSKASLLQSGIIQFTTSSLMTNRGTTIQPEKGLYWIRATFTENDEDENIAALPNILKIYAQAAVATFNNQDNELSHLKQGIEPNTISKLVNQVQTIKSVTQPLSSFDGRPEEDQQAYYRRVSERLRHKNRAVNIWDYERLILEAFPEVFHAKTLSHTSKSCNIAPGKVMVAVFPDLRNRADVNPFTPGFAIGKLERIEDYLRERANLFLFCEESIQVVNPIYELVKVKCCVRFRPGFSPAFYKTQLNTDLHGFLAPWTLNFETAELMFSGELHTSTILHFIEERPYVDVVSNFEVYHYTIDLQTGEPKNPPTLTTTELIRTKTARSILTTYADGHEITLWGDSGCDDCKTPEFTDFNICNS
ncbi:MAG: baseplate J/gp47 family protein [Bacteroidota bacterium]